jgi:hypothetical protein
MIKKGGMTDDEQAGILDLWGSLFRHVDCGLLHDLERPLLTNGTYRKFKGAHLIGIKKDGVDH